MKVKKFYTASPKIPAVNIKYKNNEWIYDETLNEIVARKHKVKGINNNDEKYRKQNDKIQRMMRKDREKIINEHCQRIKDNTINNVAKV